MSLQSIKMTSIPRTAVLCAVACLGLTACAKNSVKIDPSSAVELASRWNGTLAVPEGMAGVVQIRGSTSMSAEGDQTHAAIEIHNATRGGVHPWHIHAGRCGSNGPILGSASAYPMLKVGGDGKSEADAKLSMPMPLNGDFYVNVHASESNMQTIVACANLAPPANR